MTHLKTFFCCLALLMITITSHAKIVFINMKPDGWRDRDLYVMDDDGSNLIQLTHTEEVERYPNWSPNGRKIVYSRNPVEGEKVSSLYLINPDGSNGYRLSEKILRAAYPVYLPNDNQNITFWTLVNDKRSLNVINIVTGAVKKLFDGGIYAPDWSPDGRHIVYGSGADIWIMDADGRNRQRLLPLPPVLEDAGHVRDFPKWSPDGTRILYKENVVNLNPIFPRESSLYLHDIHTDTQKVLPLPKGWRFYGSLWMGNDTLLISAEEDGLKLQRNWGANLYRYHIPTDTMTQLTDLPGEEFSADWYPEPLTVDFQKKTTTTWGDIKTNP